MTDFLSPYRDKYYADYERGFIQRSWKRMLDPRNMTFVAVEASAPKVPIGYAVFHRFGTDSGARRQIKSQSQLLLRILGILFYAYALVLGWIVGRDRSADPERIRKFEEYDKEHRAQYWEVEARKERWHALSVVVSSPFQGKGIGKRLMAEVIARAEEEGVFVGLEASGPGEQLYYKVGFELLGRFRRGFGETEEVGGVMLYTPGKLRT